MAKKSGRLSTSDWSKYDGTCESVFKNDGITESELKAVVEFAYRDFYFRPRYMIKRLLSLRTLDEFYYALKSGIIMLCSFFKKPDYRH
jgi:hypothetical protein